MNDFRSDPNELKEAILKAVRRVLDSGNYILADECINFESLWSKACGVQYGIGVGNGMDAIEIILRSMGIGPGDEVITTPMTAFATVLSIIRAGAIPVLADIDSQTAQLSMESVKRCVGAKTKAILLVHLYGQICHPIEWVQMAKEMGIYLIEDCAQAHLALFDGKRAGSFGEAGAFSFYPTKNLGALGDAGMIITNSEKIAKNARIIRNYGQSERYHHPQLGMNSRLDEIQAAILSEKLNWLEIQTNRRREIANIYFDGIRSSEVQLMKPPKQSKSHVYHLFSINCKSRDLFKNYLLSKGIQTNIHYPIPIHKQAPCINLKRDSLGLANSEIHSNTCLSLPCHQNMSDESAAYIVDAINNFN